MRNRIKIKICPCCGGAGPFTKNRQTKDGLDVYCAKCKVERNKAYLKTKHGKEVRKKYLDSERGKEVRRKYCESEYGKETIKDYRESKRGKEIQKRYQESEHGKKAQREYRDSKYGKEVQRKAQIKYREKFPEKYHAMGCVSIAIGCGKLICPSTCSINNEDCKGRIEAHHEDYTKPLEVIWLCRFHHLQRHQELKGLTCQIGSN